MTNTIDQALAALDGLQQAEAEYRLMHDRHGDGSRAAGRAWDLMRREGDKARAVLNAMPARQAHEALQSLQEGWRAIDSAPKDGTWFLAYWPVNTLCDRVQSTSWEGCRFMDGVDFFDWCQPTHWMPLPPAPGEPS